MTIRKTMGNALDHFRQKWYGYAFAGAVAVSVYFGAFYLSPKLISSPGVSNSVKSDSTQAKSVSASSVDTKMLRDFDGNGTIDTLEFKAHNNQQRYMTEGKLTLVNPGSTVSESTFMITVTPDYIKIPLDIPLYVTRRTN